MTDKIEVIQADREAAWPYRPSCYKVDDYSCWMAGKYDLAATVIKGFAHHRLASTADAQPVAWMPIETAPKDGTTIDVWINGEFPGRRTDVSWREPTDSEWWVHGGDTIETPDATWHDCFGPLGSCEQPTYWMPLPPAPALTTYQEQCDAE